MCATHHRNSFGTTATTFPIALGSEIGTFRGVCIAGLGLGLGLGICGLGVIGLAFYLLVFQCSDESLRWSSMVGLRLLESDGMVLPRCFSNLMK